MKWVKRIAGAIIAIVVILVAVAYILPRHVSAERSVTINAPAERVFPLVNDLEAFSTWSPWSKLDPNMQVSYSGPDSGVGQKMTWQSDHSSVGNGAQEIVESEENKRVVTALDFGSQGAANAAFDLEPDGDGTKVTWSFETDLGMNPIGRYFGLVIGDWVGADYEKGLASLKQLAESSE